MTAASGSEQRAAGSRRATPRAPGLISSALSLAMLMLVGVIAFTSRQPPPPTIAEFAPQAIERIEDAPPEQSSDTGGGSGGGGIGGEPSPEPTDLDDPIDVPRVRRCVGNPPRQIEDPQSPPCVPFWAGDNGGSTARGVTRDSITIVIPTEGEKREQIYEPLRRFFNKRFEFYGRKLEFKYIRDNLGTANPETQQAEAQQAHDLGAFATTFYRASQGLYYHERASQLEIVNATGILNPFEGAYLRQWAPYMWQYYLEADDIFGNVGIWTCRRLVGRKAEHAGTDLRARDRVIGIIHQTYYDKDPTTTIRYENELRRCGHPIPKERRVRNGVRSDAGGETTQVAAVDPVTSTNVILQMKNAGVTTIFCPCNIFTAGALQKAATNQNYFPEWIFTSYGPMDINCSIVLGSSQAEQMEHAMGLTFQPMQVSPEAEPFWWAIREVDPSQTLPRDGCTVQNRAEIYRPLLLLASGIQMAGPNLTPATFASGLHRARFPNPVHVNMAGAVGFNDGGYAMTIDGAEMWWQNGGEGSPYVGDAGNWCYADGGRRYRDDSWPTGRDNLFKGPCDGGVR